MSETLSKEQHPAVPAEIAQHLGASMVEMAMAESLQATETDTIRAVDEAEVRFPELGKASEVFVVSVGDAKMPVLNFTEKSLPETTLEAATSAFSRVAGVVGLNNAGLLRARLAIVPGSVIQGRGKAIATADRETHIIRIAENAFTQPLTSEQSKEDYYKLLGNEVSEIDSTLVHELGHVVEFMATEDRLGGENDPRLIKDFFGVTSLLEAPYRSNSPQDISDLPVRIYKAGEYTDSNAAEVYGKGATVTAPTKYAQKNAGEYFAETFTAYAYDGAIEESLKDLMQSTLDTKLPGGMRQAGPAPAASIEKII